jgi:hypothetical protein
MSDKILEREKNPYLFSIGKLPLSYRFQNTHQSNERHLMKIFRSKY